MHVVWASLSFLHISCSVLVGVVEFRKLFKEREEGKKERKKERGGGFFMPLFGFPEEEST